MTEKLTIALDAMGGDSAPAVIVQGAALAARHDPELHFIFFGDENVAGPMLAAETSLVGRYSMEHTDSMVLADDKPSVALRNRRSSSMRLAIDSVKAGRAQAIISAGNTGALLAIAKFVLRTLPGIDRPAIATVLPNAQDASVVLDLGANIDCDVLNLVQFAIMGSVFAQIILGKEKPSVGLMNVGAEEMKGDEKLREAAALLRETPLPGSFYGFVEGDSIGAGTVDVVVMDGFAGNVALKAIEGTARLLKQFISEAFRSSLVARIGYLISRGAMNRLRERMDPRRYNGALFLGLSHVCIKSHGGTDAYGFSQAIKVAANLVRNRCNDRIGERLASIAEESLAQEVDVS
ncbi:MAG TPA: phosphate acyltransferase PlsX [Rhodospirillaceae bacterium]|nr:MAG: phosphate acyltransferase [Alphaproteobacteria bacterium GWF2_58_20]HAU29713.1 phosphate acyltransferase PlsX [Rhodospirillaceae bacterium]